MFCLSLDRRVLTAIQSETSHAQPDEEAVTRNANAAIPLDVNVVAGVVAFGLVVLAI